MVSPNTVLLIVLTILVIFGIYKLFFDNGSNNKKTTKTNATIREASDKKTGDTPKPNAKLTLYGFFHPSCGYCTQFKPIWEKIKNFWDNNPDVVLKTIDASLPESENLIFYYNVRGYPTLILTTPDQNIEYEEDRTMDKINNFINKHLTQ